MKLEDAIQLHEELRVWYSVIEYVAELRTHDDGRTVIVGKGSSPQHAIDDVQRQLISVRSLAELRRMPSINVE